MALFGFNKQKVLASAEKYVQQGKLQNAISEYEKVLKNDPKDLTVNNTVGDLYSRIGESDKATECFKSVGDAYASQGFTVKAIAMYKKICKLKPSLESLLKLAELYTQQGLFNDARAQYLQVADEFLKAGELENAVRIFQKILEMDPENSSMRVKLAEVYIRLGKKNDAWQIFSAAAESMRSKGSLSGAEEVLQRMLTLDPGNTYALLMQGKNMLESGDGAGAVSVLQKIADIDSNPDGLRDLLKGYLLTGQLSEAGTIANKLLTVHNDLNAIATFADALMQAGQYETALQVFDEHAERLLAENSDKVLKSLHTIIGHVRDNPDSLQKLLDLFNKAGETTHVSEVIELLAHASVQAGDLPRARDLYQKLAQVEPQNPLHMQNYQQVVSQLGGTSGVKLITPEEAVVLIDDLEATAPSVHQHYSDEVALAVRSALTDAELFISYNMPAKALGPLTSALPLAPNDLRLNQRLAALHTRAARFAEAAVCCRTLQSIYSDAEHPEEATRYGELAERYEERSSTPAPRFATEEAPIYLDAPAPAAQSTETEVAEFAVDSVDESLPEISIDEPEAAAAEEAAVEAASPWPAASGAAAEPEFAVVDESTAAPAEAAEATEEIDLSSEWDDTITVEADDAPPAAVEEPAEAEPVVAAQKHEAADPRVDETVEEIRFYVGHGMPEQAMAALAKLQTLTRDQAKIDELRAEVDAAMQPAEEAAVAEPAFEEITAEDVPSIEAVEETPVAVEEEPAQVEPEAAAIEEIPVVAEVAAEPEPEPEPAPVVPEPVPVAHEPEPAAQPAILKEFVTDLESSMGDGFLPGTVNKPSAPAAPVAHAAPKVAAAPPAPVLGEFVADIEASLGEDFLKAAPVAESKPAAAPKAKPEPPPAPVAPVAAVAPVPVVKPSPLAASAAASAAPSAPASVVQHAVQAPAFSAPVAPAASTSAISIGAPKAQPVAPVLPSAAPAKSSPFGEDAGIDLAEMFGELKQDLEADVASADEDPETHYNLGIAFREMGLLDEAIGELQKACQAFDHGRPFQQIMQAYTWLAQCFLEKGVPEAAVRWYEKALNVPNIDGETRVALNYELASAYETAGDKPAALKHFMDVYGSNIDYRDVAERIKALKS
ncbi:MAG TPA: tetratricopeptide repeat protein [Candidatus Dormibacteraeota bacterium]|nr:tetratricopeptide repeat protein [Candidatus Dormibacteraeota bacterium]